MIPNAQVTVSITIDVSAKIQMTSVHDDGQGAFLVRTWSYREGKWTVVNELPAANMKWVRRLIPHGSGKVPCPSWFALEAWI